MRLVALLGLIGLALVGLALGSPNRPSAAAATGGTVGSRLVAPGLAADGASAPATATPTSSALSGFQVVFLDVGQGDAELITVAGHRMLIDGGRSGATIVQRLNALGVTQLDAVVATHPDADHVGGLAAVLQEFVVDDIYVNGDSDTTESYSNFLAAAAAEPGALIHTHSAA
jgi:beta-lactamase superfamily II metal-dependent hydrolase